MTDEVAPRTGYPADARSNGSGRPPRAAAPLRYVAGSAQRLRRLARSLAPFAAALAPPRLDPLVMAGEQHLRHAPAAVLGRAGVVGILGVALRARR